MRALCDWHTTGRTLAEPNRSMWDSRTLNDRIEGSRFGLSMSAMNMPESEQEPPKHDQSRLFPPPVCPNDRSEPACPAGAVHEGPHRRPVLEPAAGHQPSGVGLALSGRAPE